MRIEQVNQNREHDHTSRHTRSAKHHQTPAAPKAINAHYGDERGQKVLSCRTRAEQATDPAAETELRYKHQGEVLQRKVDTRHLLEHLD